MIIFKKVRCRNFFSVGNQFIETTLNTHKTTLVCGENGTGKTCTTLDAICFGLYNKSYRSINLPQIVNSINGRECEVEVEFSIGTKEYKVRRGLSPRLFEIYVNGTMLNQTAANTDMQEFLENDILHMTYKTFTQVVILGSMSFVSFMRLKASDRKTVIEDIFDIGIFSVMLQKLKVKTASLKSAEEETHTKLLVAKQHVSTLEDTAAKAAVRSSSKLAELQKKIDATQQEIVGYKYAVHNLDQKITVEQSKISTGIHAFKAKHDKVVEIHHKLSATLQKIDRDITFFETNLVCPTCSQAIQSAVKDETVIKKKSKKIEIETAVKDLQSKQTALQEQMKQIENSQSLIAGWQKEVDRKQMQIAHLQFQITSTEREMRDINNTANISAEELEAAKNAVLSIIQETERHARTRYNYELVGKLLSEDGAKSKIVQRYLPVLNQLINQYLNRLGFMVDFNINSSFEETIRSRYRDEFSYMNFSAGERLRIDLALLFAFRAVAEKRSSICTNLVILDEIMDSSIDQSCIDDLTSILTTLSGNTNTVVISHRDLNADKFVRVIRVVRDGNFTQVKDEVK